MLKYGLLVYLGLAPVFAVIILSAFVIWTTPTNAELEVRRIRLAGATLVALVALFIFTAILYFVDAGKEIFDMASTVIFALVGTITGYIFGSTRT